jgi:hypothetical protein
MVIAVRIPSGHYYLDLDEDQSRSHQETANGAKEIIIEGVRTTTMKPASGSTAHRTKTALERTQRHIRPRYSLQRLLKCGSTVSRKLLATSHVQAKEIT